MSKELYLHTLQQIRDGCLAENMDTEAEALEAAIQALSCDGDCISRQEAIDAVSSIENLDAKARGGICFKLIGLPSAQPEIIRCKDCVKREHCRTTNVWAIAPSDDWYCADAERRTDGKP